MESSMLYMLFGLVIGALLGYALKRFQLFKNSQLITQQNNLRLLEKSTDLISRHDEQGNYLWVSPSCQTLLGYRPDELIGASAYQLVHPDDLKQVSHSHETILEDQKSLTVTWRQKHKDGHYIWVETVSLIATSESGQPEIHAITRDISDRHKMEETLQATQHKHRALVDTLLEGVALHRLLVNPEGEPYDYEIYDINPAYLQHTGLESSTVLNRPSCEVYQTQTPAYWEEFTQVVYTGKPYIFQTYFPPLDKHFQISVVSHLPGEFATIFEDITQRVIHEKEKESLIRELEQKNFELERYAYSVSHDLRSPLVTIQGFAHELKQDMDDGDLKQAHEDAKQIIMASERMSNLLNGILQLSRVGRISNPPTEFNLESLFEEVRQNLTGPLKNHGVGLTWKTPLPSLKADRSRLQEVLQNLIENAIKYRGENPQPKIQILVSKDYDWVTLSIQDNGIGIDPSMQEKVFRLFHQLDPDAEGMGIGLSLCKRIIEHFGGSIWVESAGLGQGSTFHCKIPKTPPTYSHK